MAGSLFLPFTPQGQRIERLAISIKDAHGYGPYDAVSPIELADRMGIAVAAASWFDGFPKDLAAEVLVRFGDAWSAGSISCEGTLCVVLNPGHPPTRQAISLAEELVHEALGHPKSRLVQMEGLLVRTCEHSVEDEAYSVATALVMPYQSLFNHVDRGLPLSDLTTPVPVSAACRDFRIKRAGLWRTYQARQKRNVGRS